MAGGDLFSTYGTNILKYWIFSNGGMHIILQDFVFVQLGERNLGFHQLQDQAFRVISGHTKNYQQLTPCMRN